MAQSAQDRVLEAQFRSIWNFGANLIVGWQPKFTHPTAIRVLYVPTFELPEIATAYSDILKQDRYVDGETQFDYLRKLGCETKDFPMVTEFGDMGSTRALINSMLQRYSVTFYENKTVALFDIVKFSVHSQFEQITQLSALSHYLKLAERRCQALKMPLSLQMSTVGDGFYVWNKFEGVKADLALYHAVSLALTYNYAARTITHAKSIPRLRCCIHSGSYYEYYQATAEMSTASPYIVGDVTIELARIISYTLSGQILIGSHVRELADNDRDLKEQFGVDTLDTLSFMSLAQLRAEHLIGSPIPGGRIEFLNLFLTGPRSAMNEFSIKTYHLKDKHGLDHRCFNARLQVKSSSGNQIAVGLIGDELEDFKADTYEFEDIRIVVE